MRTRRWERGSWKVAIVAVASCPYQCCIQWATSDAWMMCSITIVAFRLTDTGVGSSQGPSERSSKFPRLLFWSLNARFQRALRCSLRALSEMSVAIIELMTSFVNMDWKKPISMGRINRAGCISCQHHSYLAEALHFIIIGVNASPETCVLVRLQNCPTKIKTILFCHTPVVVLDG